MVSPSRPRRSAGARHGRAPVSPARPPAPGPPIYTDDSVIDHWEPEDGTSPPRSHKGWWTRVTLSTGQTVDELQGYSDPETPCGS